MPRVHVSGQDPKQARKLEQGDHSTDSAEAASLSLSLLYEHTLFHE